jgi:hypothetical protein
MKKNASIESIGAKRYLAVFFAFSLLLTLLIFMLLAVSSTLHGLLSPLACNPGEVLEWSAGGGDYAYCCIGGKRGCVWINDGVLDEGPGNIVMLTSFLASLPFSLASTLAVPRRFMLMVR